MYDRFGEPRVDDEEKHLPIHQQVAINNRSSDGITKPLGAQSTIVVGRQVETTHAAQEGEPRTSTIGTNKSLATPNRRISDTDNIRVELAAQLQLQASISETETAISSSPPPTSSSSSSLPPATAASEFATSSSSSSSAYEIAPAELTVSSSYQLRALTGNTVEEEAIVGKSLDVDSLSLKLIEETLNYFISCRHRLNQITKTFDDSNALIMLLQEREEDLEVVGQLGQDLLRRYNELKDAYEEQRQELARSLEDNQQLRYDLASNKSLLDTFKEAEEHLLDEHNTGSRVCPQCQADEEGQAYSSLRSQQHQQEQRSLTYLENELYKQICELKDELLEVRERELNQKLLEQELAVQLRDSQRRQTELEGENEILRDQQRNLQLAIETQNRRFDELLGIFTEYQHETRLHHLNESSNTINNHLQNNISFNYLTESSPSYDSQLDSLLFVDQPRSPTDTQQQRNHHLPLGQNQARQQAAATTPTTTPTTSPIGATNFNEQHQNQQIVRPIVRKSSSSNLVTSTSLHEELLESMHKANGFHVSREDSDEDSDEEDEEEDNETGVRRGINERDGIDSGLHTRNISTSTTPVGGDKPSDSTLSPLKDSNLLDAGDLEAQGDRMSKRLSCLGLSTFTLTTLLLLCLSTSFNSSTSSNLAQKLQQINLNQ